MHSVEVAGLDGSNRKVLFTGLRRPRAITTHYPSGRLFWTDWDEKHPSIGAADMDGNNRCVRVLVSSRMSGRKEGRQGREGRGIEGRKMERVYVWRDRGREETGDKGEVVEEEKRGTRGIGMEGVCI